ncbi:MAG TPA: potassium channel family protein, partial [Acidimicrobiia bacterium]|nr:potassium channel family protein [Acidimicrobiia bacterium]
MALVGGLLIAYYVLPMDSHWWPVPAVAGPAAIVALVPLSLRHTRTILLSDRPLASVARAILVMMFLLILGFATTYYALQAHWPGEMEGLRTKTDAVYFTVTVLSTVGFGDIHPVGQAARAVATFHMLANLVVVSVSVRLVIRAGRHRL